MPLLILVPFEFMDNPPILLPLVPNAREKVAPERVLLAVKLPSVLYILVDPNELCATLCITNLPADNCLRTANESEPVPLGTLFNITVSDKNDGPATCMPLFVSPLFVFVEKSVGALPV